MAALGAAIVFSGLAILSFAIAQIAKLINWWDRRAADAEAVAQAPDSPVEGGTSVSEDLRDPADMAQMARLYEPIVRQMSDPFELVELHRLARENDLPFPHIAISWFRNARILVPQGDGMFSWNSEQ